MKISFNNNTNIKDDDSRKGDCFKINLEVGTDAKRLWKEAVLRNLHMHPASLANVNRVHVARHHWSLEQLRHFTQGLRKKNLSTPLPRQTPKNIAHDVDHRCTMIRIGESCVTTLQISPLA